MVDPIATRSCIPTGAVDFVTIHRKNLEGVGRNRVLPCRQTCQSQQSWNPNLFHMSQLSANGISVQAFAWDMFSTTAPQASQRSLHWMGSGHWFCFGPQHGIHSETLRFLGCNKLSTCDPFGSIFLLGVSYRQSRIPLPRQTSYNPYAEACQSEPRSFTKGEDSVVYLDPQTTHKNGISPHNFGVKPIFKLEF